MGCFWQQVRLPVFGSKCVRPHEQLLFAHEQLLFFSIHLTVCGGRMQEVNLQMFTNLSFF